MISDAHWIARVVRLINEIITHCCCRAAVARVWWRRTSPRGRCPWSRSGTSNRTPPSIRQTSRRSPPPSPRRWWPGRSGTGSSCPRPPVSSRAWSRCVAAAGAPDGITVHRCHQNLLMWLHDVTRSSTQMTSLYKEVQHLFKCRGRCHFGSIKGPQEKHGPRRGVHPESWEHERENP